MNFSTSKSQKVFSNNQYFNEYIKDQLKDFLTGLIEQILEVEFSEYIRRKKYARIGKTTGVRLYRNGYRKRNYTAKFCIPMQIRVPRVRGGNFIPGFWKERGIIDPGLKQLLIHQWTDGNSYRDIKNFVKTAYGNDISIGLMHRIIKAVDKYVKEYHVREIRHQYDAIYIDGLEISLKDHPPRQCHGYGNRRKIKIGKNMVLLGVLGQRREGVKTIREMIDYRISETENSESYTELFSSLKKRGLKAEKFRLAIHDGLAGSITIALRNVYGKDKVLEQECMFHKLLNVTKLVKDDRNHKELRTDVWKVYSQKSLKLYTESEKNVLKKWRLREPEAMAVFERYNENLKTKYNFDERIHKSIETNNPIERYFKELRRRIKAIGLFENKESADRLIYLVVESLNQKRGSLPTNDNFKFTH